MNNIEILSAGNADRLEEIGVDLAESYKVAFAGPPWFEVSRCEQLACKVGFSSFDSSCLCPSCNCELVDAYKVDKLVKGWVGMLELEDAMMEVSYIDGVPQRATIARPTTPDELATRKYAKESVMAPVLGRLLPKKLVWIEDTFANRARIPNGNLRSRGQTLDRIDGFYGGRTTIATRTLASGIVAATLRDKPGSTRVLIGSERVGADIVNARYNNPGYSLPEIPDRRTLLVINNAGDL